MDNELPPIHAKTTKDNFLRALENFKDIDENKVNTKKFSFAGLEGPVNVTVFSADVITTRQEYTSKYSMEIKIATTNHVPNAWRTEDE